MSTPAIPQPVWSVSGWAWFALILAASVAFWPSFPDGGVAKLIFVFALAGVAALQLARLRHFDAFDAILAVVVTYACLSALWAADSQGAADAAFVWLACGLIAMAARRLPSDQPILAALVACATINVCAHFIFPAYFAGFGNENYATWWFVAAFPGLCAAFMLWPAATSFAIIISAIYVLFWNGAHVEVAAIAAWVAILALRAEKMGKWVLAGGILLIAALLVGLVPDSINYRLQLWQAALAIWWANPFFGVGIGGYDTLYGLYAPASQGVTNSAVTTAGAAHSDVLQAFSDLGIVGAFLVATALWTALRPGNRAKWPVYTIIGIFALACIDFPLQTPAVALLGALALGRCRPVKADYGYPASTALVGVPLTLGFLYAGTAMVAAQKDFALVGPNYAKNPIASHILAERAYQRWPYSKRIRRELLFAALASGVDDYAVQRAITAAQSAYKGNRRIDRLIADYKRNG